MDSKVPSVPVEAPVDTAFSVAVTNLISSLEGAKKRNILDQEIFQSIIVILEQVRRQRIAIHAGVAIVGALTDEKWDPKKTKDLVALFLKAAARARCDDAIPDLKLYIRVRKADVKEGSA